ncbi:MmcQ/YjbR family DNA-binding protein [Aquihabitans sp. G128]|uniref:MmcQ/YjbR family DNA-binding protein n=1 Tax=Aquihabitans sp. G128 TaxID=2849779 RepID=UPI001C2402DF|nr:MmcQ/YjbR family DNA-binding protein [Aquihabitans sp. G128]QXC60813.1 MmcQ/YjbR family DNA-binding protein [Aquihabitans sp. G128]
MATERQAQRALALVRGACLALPEVEERLSHGTPSFFVRGKKCFAMYQDDHHGDGILGVWCAAPAGVQGELVEAEPERFFVPPYVGHRGWLGVHLDRSPDPVEVAAILTEAYRQVAPKVLLRQLDADADGS